MKLQEAIQGIDPHIWSSEPDVGQLIAALIKLHSFKDIVEIGVFKGFTSSYIIDSLPDNGKYIGIDMEDYRVDSVRQFFKEKGHSFHLGDSKIELKKLKSNSADLIFLDGDHSLDYVKAEFLESLRIIRKKGIICIHDYNTYGVKTWVNYVNKFRRFSVIIFNTSENRGIAVIVCKTTKHNGGWWFRFLFLVTRNKIILKLEDKIKIEFGKIFKK